jgi:hypothetical protein
VVLVQGSIILGWLLANKKLEIKVVIPRFDEKIKGFEDIDLPGMFHQKVGILTDKNNDIITFSGSINETALGWKGNVEEFKVFKNWESTELGYVNADREKFDRFWDDKSEKVRTVNIPRAVEEKLIRLAPIDVKELGVLKSYIPERHKVNLFKHQEEYLTK